MQDRERRVEKEAATDNKKSVSFVLGIGIVFIPFIFAWFTLRNGYSGFARVMSIGWLCIVLIANFATPSEEKTYEAKQDLIPSSAKSEPQAVKPKPLSQTPKNNEVGLTGPQRNAVRSAKQYLDMSGFSRKGLIEQLSSEYGNQYAVDDATVAVDSMNIDWKENAARSAKQYLSMSGFSCKGLIEQLSSEYGSQYTKEQAKYGAIQAGAC